MSIVSALLQLQMDDDELMQRRSKSKHLQACKAELA